MTRELQHGLERWTVREVDTRTVPGARGERCLICESVEVIRRLWDYPADWASLDDEALLAVCERDAR